MAQVINSYNAELVERDYIFDQPGTSGGKTQYEAGTQLRLPANYGERETNGYYPVISPQNGWVSFMVVEVGAPNYTTVTDACTAPSSLKITGSLLTISGGGGGDLNAFTGFGVSWRERAIDGNDWGGWSAESVTTSRTINVSANAGKVRQYRARTMGSAGEAYYSGYTVCATLVSGNTAASAPAIMIPANEAITISDTPVIVVACGADPDGDVMKLQRNVDGYGWADIKSVSSAGATVYDKIHKLGNGRHAIAYRVTDANGAVSGAGGVTIIVEKAAWTRDIASGDVIANKNISHAAEINEMLYAVNIQRVYYALQPITLPGTVGVFGDWGKQMRKMLDSVNECAAAAGQQLTELNLSDAFPNAAMINAIRDRVTFV